MKAAKEFILRDIAGECVLVPTGATTQLGQLLQAGFVTYSKEDKTW